jgi:UDP-glucose 4-epimerase
MRVLVTGGAGFIGSHIAEHFSGKADVRVLDNLRSGYIRNLDGLDIKFIEGSITDVGVVRYAVKGVDYVFHLAAMVSVPESMQDPLGCVDINTCGLLNILKMSAEMSVKKLVFSSSAAIYGDNPVMPKCETMLPEPKSPYAVTKLDGEYYCRIFHDEGWLNTVSLRYFNVFGPRQDPKSQYAAVIPIFIHRAIHNEPITIYGDGTQTRDFIFVKDVVAANVHLATNEELTGVYNVAYGRRQTIQKVAEKIIDLTGSSSKIEYGPVRPGDVKHSEASIDKILAADFVPSGRFDDGLGQTIEFFKDRVQEQT